MLYRRILPLLFVLLAMANLALPGGSRAQKPTADDAAAITIVMEDCQASRPGKIGNAGILSLLLSGPPKEELVKRGTAEVDGQKYTLYLPKAKAYSIKNTKADNSAFENTSTLISVDHNRDGKLTDD